MANYNGDSSPSPFSEPARLKRYFQEDAEDIRIIQEASKRLKTRRNNRLVKLFSDPEDPRLESSSSDDSYKPHSIKNESSGSFEIGRELNSLEKARRIASPCRHEGSSSDKTDSDIDINNPDGSLNFVNTVKAFSYSNYHQKVEVLFCGSCYAFPEDPFLTDCLHLYCAECFSELLVKAKGEDNGLIQCQAEEDDEINNYIPLNESMLQMLANSVGLCIGPSNEVGVCETVVPDRPRAPVLDITGPELDDVAALWHVVKPALADNRLLAMPRNQSIPAVASFQDLINLANRVRTSEVDNDGLSDEDGRSTGYATPNEDGLSLSDASSHSFINDGEIKLPFYNSESESSEQDPSNDSDEGSEISLTELRDLSSPNNSRWTGKVGVVALRRDLGFGGLDDGVDGPSDERQQAGREMQRHDSADEDGAVSGDEVRVLNAPAPDMWGSEEKPIDVDLVRLVGGS